jgi:Uma2 family endonuclease
MPGELTRRRFTVDEYFAMADAGILKREDHVELIEGEIIQMTPIGSRHAACVSRLNRLLLEQAGSDAIVRVQSPMLLSDLSAPEPDFLLARPHPDHYAAEHPRPSDTLLLIEVAHTTLAYDRGTKLALYAAAKVPEVWIVDVDGRAVEVYKQPEGMRYLSGYRLGPADTVRSELLPSVVVEVSRVVD